MNDAGFEFRRVLHMSKWTQSDVAMELGVSTAAVNQWAKRGIPAGRVIDIQRLTEAPLADVEAAVYNPPPKRPTPRYDRGYQSYAKSGESREVLLRVLDEWVLQDEDIKLVTAMVKRLGRKKI
jgi:transcriptional regulator with XRE-family HTH domain